MPCTGLKESDASMRQRLVNSLSNSFPGSALTKALKCIKDEDVYIKVPLSSSCFADLCLEREAPGDDKELTSLSWLQNTNLLKDIKVGEKEDTKENHCVKHEPGHTHTHPIHGLYNQHKHANSKPPYSFSCLIFMALEESPTRMLPVKDIYEWILNHFPYFHNALSCWKNSVRHNLSLNKCFKKVEKYRGQTIGKGSLWCVDPDYRPNLVQALHKTPYHPYRQLLMSSHAPQSQQNLNILGFKSQPLQPRIGTNSVSPCLFPFLSRHLGHSHSDIDSDVQDVAQTLVSLKNWSKAKADDASFAQGLKRKCGECITPQQVLQKGPQVICAGFQSIDHTYSITRVEADDDEYVPGSPGSSIDDEYDFSLDNHTDEDFSNTRMQCHRDKLDNELKSGFDKVDGCVLSVYNNNSHRKANWANVYSASKCQKFVETSEDEKKRLADGANALLNLAEICFSRQHMPLTRAISAENLVEIKDYHVDQWFSTGST